MLLLSLKTRKNDKECVKKNDEYCSFLLFVVASKSGDIGELVTGLPLVED